MSDRNYDWSPGGRETLLARIKELEAERDRLRQDLTLCEQGYPNVGDIEALKAERDRLREENETLKRRLRQAEQLLGDFPDELEEE